MDKLQNSYFSVNKISPTDGFYLFYFFTYTTAEPRPTEPMPDESSWLKARSSQAAVVCASPVSFMYWPTFKRRIQLANAIEFKERFIHF